MFEIEIKFFRNRYRNLDGQIDTKIWNVKEFISDTLFCLLLT